MKIRASATHCIKLFEEGQGVRIISGIHAGETGMIASIINNKHAIVILDLSLTELKILLTNL